MSIWLSYSQCGCEWDTDTGDANKGGNATRRMLKVNCQLKYKIWYLVESALHFMKLKSDFRNSVLVTSNLMLKLGFHLLCTIFTLKPTRLLNYDYFWIAWNLSHLYETSNQKFIYDFAEYQHINIILGYENSECITS